MSTTPDSSPPLTARESEALLERVADVAAAGLPLADGLRAAADEVLSRRLSGELQAIAEQVERGQPLEDVLAGRHGRRADYVGGLIRAGIRSRNLGPVLLALVDQRRTLRELRRSILAALAYPAILLVLALAITLFIEFAVVGVFVRMYQEFQLQLPYVTLILVWGYGSGVWWLLATAAVVVVAAVGFRLVAGASRWRRVQAVVPLVGALGHWSGVAEWSRLMSLLLDQGLPAPEALRLAAAGVEDANVREVSGQLGEQSQQGRPLAELLAENQRLPASLAPLVNWGESSGQLAEAFRVASEMFEGRVRMRSALLRSMLPPLVFVGVATWVLFLVIGLYAPMIAMIQGLS